MIITFTGDAGAGKSTAAGVVKDYLTQDLFLDDPKIIKFAGPLKDMMRALGLTEDEIEGDLKEEPCSLLQGKTPRYAMQTIGTEWGRDMIGPCLWTTSWARRVHAQEGAVTLVDDVRFPNEITTVQALAHKYGGVHFHLKGRSKGLSDHPSESSLRVPGDVVIANPEGTTHEQLLTQMREYLP